MNVAPFLMLNTLGRPLANSVLEALPRTGILGSPGMLDMIAGILGGTPSDGRTSSDIEDMYQRIDNLEKKIVDQQSEIAALASKTDAAKNPTKKKKK